jgi:hypothetical protein
VGRVTAADTGKPLAGATIRVLIEGVPRKENIAEARSDADGRYTFTVPLGHCRLWGVYAPPGYYTQSSKTFAAIVTTAAKPEVVRDFLLQPGSPWHAEVQGAKLPLNPPPFFSSWPDPERERHATGEAVTVCGDARGKAVLTIPPKGGNYRFGCLLLPSPSPYEIPAANLEIDKDFDPRRIQGKPEPLADGKAVRLRDVAGRVAVVEGAEVVVEAGQAVLRFHAQPIPKASALRLHGAVVDEAGKPIVGAKVTAAFASGGANGPRVAAISQLEARTDAQGKFEFTQELLPQSLHDPDPQVSMIVIKAGFDGAQTKELSLREIRPGGTGDFGTVVLRPGHMLRGKVVDENGRPVHGAVVTNDTNYFLYGHLQCRTDADGRFVMPDLSFGSQKLSAQYGERSGHGEFNFEANSGDCVIAVRLHPKLPSVTGVPQAALPVRLASPDSAWDLTPPLKEPKYRHEPQYALLVFGPHRQQRIWLVLDGTTLYVDRNGNGDLTEPDERMEPQGSTPFGNPGSHTHFDVFLFAVRTGATAMSKFRLEHWIRAENFTPKSDFDKKWHAKWLKWHWENSTLWRLDGQGRGQTPLLFMLKPADAQVCVGRHALDGPLTFVLKVPEYQVLRRGEAGSDLAFHIGVMGHPPRGDEQFFEQQFFNRLATKEVPEGAHLEVEIEYPAKAPNASPLRRKFLLKQRC